MRVWRMRLRRWFVVRSFRRKIMAVAIVCILLPALITMLIYNDLTQSAVKRQTIANSTESLQLVGGSVSNVLESMLKIANYVQNNPNMTAYFKSLVYQRNTDENADAYTRFEKAQNIREQLDTLAAVRGDCYVTVLLINDDYFMNYSINDYNPLDFKEKPWFRTVQGLQGLQSYWVPSEPADFRIEQYLHHTWQISVVQALRVNSSKVYGYVIVTVMENQIRTLFNGGGQGREVMLLDGNHRILSSGNPARIGKVFPYSGAQDSAQPSQLLEVDGTRELVVRQDLPFAGWQLVSMQPYKQAVANIQSIFNKVFLLQLLSFLVFLLLLLILLRRFTAPLIRLGRTAATVQLGNLSVRSGVRGQDEIGRLGRSFDLMLERIDGMILEITRAHERKRRAELAMLQAQIKPHFLFNVLNSIRMKVMLHGDGESAEMIQSLSRLLRMTTSREQGMIPLHEELELAADYIRLMNMRQREKVELKLDVSSRAIMLGVPRFCLQPIIENAIIHGLDRRAGIIRIEADVRTAADSEAIGGAPTGAQGGECLRIGVWNSGVAMTAGTLRELRRKLHGEWNKETDDEDERHDDVRSGNGGTADDGIGGGAGDGVQNDAIVHEDPVQDDKVMGGGDGVSGGAGDHTVHDDARDGAASHRSPSSSSGIGLRNVHERLRMTYGPEAAMEIESEAGKGTLIVLSMPTKGANEHVQRNVGG